MSRLCYKDEWTSATNVPSLVDRKVTMVEEDYFFGTKMCYAKLWNIAFNDLIEEVEFRIEVVPIVLTMRVKGNTISW